VLAIVATGLVQVASARAVPIAATGSVRACSKSVGIFRSSL
jgi:hypothetical protein